MTVYFEEEGKHSLPLACEELAREVAEGVLEDAGCPYEAQMNLLLTDDEQIREINREFRNIDAPTDVLSFPAAEYEVPGIFAFMDGRMDLFDPDTGELLLGDIMISKERVTAQAEEYGHSIKREFAFLIAHSVLHLIGYDHVNEDERTAMEEKQRQILDVLRIYR
ncbi:MAG: rRNA maturation RNase YbeY [Dorea sp.]|jgi:probable rRNA maturation factor|nr:rRNA maturation RNase YbeY [Dorea sp.]